MLLVELCSRVAETAILGGGGGGWRCVGGGREREELCDGILKKYNEIPKLSETEQALAYFWQIS